MSNRCKVIAEIGINHQGNIDNAKRLIDVAAIAGCDYVKFQKRTPDVCVPHQMRNVIKDSPIGVVPYIDYKKAIEFWEAEYNQIDHHCKEIGIEWFASAWDPGSQRFLRDYNMPCNKVASAMLTNTELLELIASEDKYTYISTGMSNLGEIRGAVEVFNKYKCPYELMHCNSAYPAKAEEINLRGMQTLIDHFGGTVGYSGHEPGIQITLAAVAMGATSIERHITLDRTQKGSDHAASLEPDGLMRLVRDIRVIEKSFGDGHISVSPAEIPMRQKLRYV